MKANELRIGNWIYNENGQIVSVLATRIVLCDDRRAIYKPIPITEEWLLKLNFTEVFEGHFESPNEMIIVSFDPLKVSIICPMPWIELEDCQFVHELQNLHFALSKTEINFDL